MAIKTEVAEIMKEEGRVYEVAEKVVGKCNLTNEDKEIAEVVDVWAKEIGRTGADEGHEISQLILKTISDPVYDKPDDIVDLMFDKDSIGEFDDYEIEKTPKNTLLARDAVKGGNVDKSYIDGSILKPTWKSAQVETELTYGQLRRNGFKSIAQLSVFAKEAMDNKKIKDAFTALDACITGGDQLIAVTGGASALTVANMDALSLYVMDMIENGDSAFAFGLNKYAQQIAKMSGYNSYMSDNMKDAYNKYGLVKEYLGMLIGGFSGQRKAADGELMVPDKRLYGVAGKIGTICDRGELRVYQDMDNNKEKVNLKFTGYEYGIKITRPEKVAKITFTA
jgi:hypothetical protein